MNPWYAALIYLVWFLSTYYVVFFFLLLFTNRDRLTIQRRLPEGKRPLVTIIVSAFDEEEKIGMTIRSLQRLAYERLEVIIVNDGSTDGTAAAVTAAIKGDSRFRFINRARNKGKAASLNEAIRLARGEFVACMDADSIVDRKVFLKALPYFADEKVGAVTISVKVKRPTRFLDKIIAFEFVIGLSLFLKILSFLDCVFVTPGPFSIYRKRVLDEIGGFDEKNVTEDLEIAYRIHRAGYRIENCMETYVETIMPPSFLAVYKQRRRWYAGAIQTMVQHRSMLFRPKYGAFSFFTPFNYLLVSFGLLLFTITTFLTVTRLYAELSPLQYTGFNLFTQLRHLEFDILRVGGVSLIGYSALALSFLVLAVGILATRTRTKGKLLGLVGYPLLFFLYQFWWTGAIYKVLTRRRITWR